MCHNLKLLFSLIGDTCVSSNKRKNLIVKPDLISCSFELCTPMAFKDRKALIEAYPLM